LESAAGRSRGKTGLINDSWPFRRMPPELIGEVKEVDWPVQVKEVIDFGNGGKGWGTKPWRKLEAPASKLKAFAPEFVPFAVSQEEGSWTSMNDASQSREVFLMEMLAAMDHHMHQLRETQQGLVATVDLACRKALKGHFGRLILVGSAALRVETPGSDVDVVCFTQRDEGKQAVGLPVTVLRRVHWCLKELLSQSSNYPTDFSTELIDDARVPILRVMWGPKDNCCAVDVSVDQTRPLDHVRWFQRVGAAPRPTEPQPPVAPLVTLTLRCVKWWLKQRQIPRTKEGGLPTVAWLLMAVHVSSLKQTNHEALSKRRPMAALLSSLASFFRHYQSLERLDGVLYFSPDGSSSEFRRRERQRGCSPWAELSVLDPTREGTESLSLVPRLHPATQLLLGHELQRAYHRIEAHGDNREMLEDALRPVPEGINALPSFIEEPLCALVVCGELSPGLGNQQVELALIEKVAPRPGWMAPFLLRSDERSQMTVRLMDLEDRSGQCRFRRVPRVTLCPANFICQVFMTDATAWRIDEEGLVRFHSMRQIVAGLREQSRVVEESCDKPKTIESVAPTLPTALQNVTNLPAADPLKVKPKPIIEKV